MARGLSIIQKTILKLISDLPEGSELHNKVYPTIKARLYPELYGIWPYPKWDGSFCMVKFIGWNIKKKNNARVVISKSIKRLVKREYLMMITESKEIFIPRRRNRRGQTIPEKSIMVKLTRIYFTHLGRQIVNG